VNRMVFAVCFQRDEVFDNVLVEITRTRHCHIEQVITAALRHARSMSPADLLGVYSITRKEVADYRTLPMQGAPR